MGKCGLTASELKISWRSAFLRQSTISLVFTAVQLQSTAAFLASCKGESCNAQETKAEPLCRMAARNNPKWPTKQQSPCCSEFATISGTQSIPLAAGDKTRKWVEAAPADSPNTVTFPGSPPNAAIFFCTHFNARIISLSPLLAGTVPSSVFRNPRTPSL